MSHQFASPVGTAALLEQREPAVYIAARKEDREVVRALRASLAECGVACTSRWIDSPVDLARIDGADAEGCLVDVDGADAVLVLSRRETFRDSTGGHHVETGYALRGGKPVILFGERQNVFHGLTQVCVVDRLTGIGELAEVIRHMCRVANDRGTAIAMELRRE